MKRSIVDVVTLLLALIELMCVPALSAQGHPTRIFIESFGNSADAEYLRTRLSARLARWGHVRIAETPQSADAVLSGVAGIRPVGRSCSNLRAHYLSHN